MWYNLSSEGSVDALTVEALTMDQVHEIYNHRMVNDFPKNERKSLAIIESAIQKGNYRCYGFIEESHILAYAFFVTIDNLFLLDYFAVDETRRGTGIDGKFLPALCETVLPDAEVAVLEVEDPDEAQSNADREKRERRFRFYRNNGMVDTGVKANVFWTDYRILRMPVGDQTIDIAEIYRSFYEAILPPALYKTMVHVKNRRGYQNATLWKTNYNRIGGLH